MKTRSNSDRARGPLPVERNDPFGLAGATLAGKYDIECVVAETELSVVYRATHRVWKRSVAIKAFKAPSLGESARQRLLEAFVREGALLMELSERCAAICQARDVGAVSAPNGDWVPYTVLEWLNGEPLDALLGRERGAGLRPRALEEAVRLLDPIAQALELAHERGIVHGDVKPSNVYVLAESTSTAAGAKLLDFGVAKVASAKAKGDERPSMHAFTPAYGAPEQFSPDYGVTGPQTDVFALALTVVEIVSGREPLRGETVLQLAMCGCDPNDRPTPRRLGVPVTDRVERVFRRALAVCPEKRYANAGDFWFALRAAMKTSTAVTRARPALPVPRRRSTRTRSWIKPAVALLGAVACVAALSRLAPWTTGAVQSLVTSAPAAAATASPRAVPPPASGAQVLRQ